MRKLLAAVLALPVLALVYLSVGLRTSPKTRVAVALIAAVAIGAGALGLRAPAGTTAVPEPTDPPLLEATLATRIEVDEAPDAPIMLHFPAAMDRDSVAALLEIDPDTPVALDWDATSTELTVRPIGGWDPGSLHTITIQAGALEASGRPSTEQVQAAFLTRAATQATIAASEVVGGRATVGTEFVIGFDRAIDEETLALAITPATEGGFEQIPGGAEGVEYRFIPDEGLAPGTEYRVALADGVRDLAGALVAAPAALVIQTSTEPTVVRFRPRIRATDVALDSTLSVRFSEAMDQASTTSAWSVTADGAAVAGKVSFAEGDTVLVFDPDGSFEHGQSVVMTVGSGATSKSGVPLAAPVSGSFTTVPKPAPTPTPTPAPRATPVPTSGGGSVGSGSWTAVESYYLKLMNCTRTGGTVSSTGGCSGSGSNGTAALWQDAGISSAVSRPYAKMLAVNNLCSHFINGDPGDRLAAAGYSSYIWAENLGCRSGDPYAAVLASHLYFQSEKSYNGGHYVNLMNAKYDRVGIGVWVASGRVRLVIDFYHPR